MARFREIGLWIIAIVSGLFLLNTRIVLAVESCEFGKDIPKSRPNPQAGPTQVRVGVFVFDLSDIDIRNSEFGLDFLAALSWQDPRLGELLRKTGRKLCQTPVDAIWHPNMFPVNARVVKDELPRIMYVRSDGTVRGKRRLIGKFAVPFDLREFPMDTQMLRVTFISLDYGPDDLSLAWQGGGRSEAFSQTGWQVKLGRGSAGTYLLDIRQQQAGDKVAEKPTGEPSESAVAFARFEYAMEVTRDLSFYVWKIVVPLVLIVFASWSVFWIDPTQMGVQIGIGTSMLLTIVAFLFTLQNLLPEISYLTRLDIFVYSSLVLVFLAFVEALVTCTLAARGKEVTARQIDRWARKLYTGLYALVIIRFWWL
jgi:hypothetical protein